VKLNYASTKQEIVPDDETQDSQAPGEKAPDDGLPETGPRETLMLALVGFGLLQLGLVFAVRANRSAPRRSAI